MRTLLATLTAGALLAVAMPLPGWAAAQPVTVARYDFDGRSGALLDDSGNGHTMRLIASRGGQVKTVVHGSGHAFQFPVKCSGASCPTAVLQSAHADDLNPGGRAITYGATIRLARSQTTGGQNVLQKGYSATSSQFKLQIDGREGRPSCVLVDVKKRTIHQVTSTVSAADGNWHTVACRRIGTALRIVVDGVVRGVTRVPAALTVSNRHPLSIGGKGTYRDNDQFRGAVDDVYVRIG